MFVTISLLLAVACLLPAAAKLTGQPRMRESAAHFGLAGLVLTLAYLVIALTG